MGGVSLGEENSWRCIFYWFVSGVDGWEKVGEGKGQREDGTHQAEFKDVYGGDGGGDVDFALFTDSVLARCSEDCPLPPSISCQTYLLPINTPVQPRLSRERRAAPQMIAQ